MYEDRYDMEYTYGRVHDFWFAYAGLCNFVLIGDLTRIHNKTFRGFAMQVMMYLWYIQSRESGSISEKHQHKAVLSN